MSNFGNIYPTKVGFGSSQDDTTPCVCWLTSNIEISILQNKFATGFNNLRYMATHEKKVECTKGNKQNEYEASFGNNPFGSDRELKIKWKYYKVCGGCKRTPCHAQKRLCFDKFESGQTTIPASVQQLLKDLWKIRRDLDQNESKIKRILKKIKKKFKHCDDDMKCDLVLKFCETTTY